jgi:hypothetical protein
MKNTLPTVGLVSGKANPAALALSEELAQQGISAIVKTKAESGKQPNCEQVRQLAGQPTPDLFFNGWKLLF